jgi:hypothetical protein
MIGPGVNRRPTAEKCHYPPSYGKNKTYAGVGPQLGCPTPMMLPIKTLRSSFPDAYRVLGIKKDATRGAYRRAALRRATDDATMTDADASSRSVSERLNIAPRIGFRHGSSVVASAHLYALRIGTKENHVSGGALQSLNFPCHARPPAAAGAHRDRRKHRGAGACARWPPRAKPRQFAGWRRQGRLAGRRTRRTPVKRGTCRFGRLFFGTYFSRSVPGP